MWHTRGVLREQAIATVEKASLSIPHQGVSKSFLNISGVFQQLHLFISLVESCLWKVQWLYVDVGFWPRWANPLWEVAGIDYKFEEEQIRTKLDAIIQQQLKSIFPSHEQPVTFLQPVAPNIRKRWWRKAKRGVQSAIISVTDLPTGPAHPAAEVEINKR